MRFSRFIIAALFAASVTGLHAQTPKSVELGTINFPTSAKPAAQAPFLTGVKALYNFEFDIAAEAFREAQKADPTFALGYWGEAMSFNHPLWAQQDLAAARKVLERLAPTAAARAAKAPAGKERELIEAAGSAVRRRRQARARHRVFAGARASAREVSGRRRDRASVRAGAARHGAARREQHAQLDAGGGDRADRVPAQPEASRAPRTSSSIRSTIPITRSWRCRRRAPTRRSRPSAAHALHMPSHIFVQLGLWDDVVASNIVAYKAAVDLADQEEPAARPRGLPHAVVAAVRAICSKESSTRRPRRWRRRRRSPTRTRARRPRRLRVDEGATDRRDREMGKARAADRRRS